MFGFVGGDDSVTANNVRFATLVICWLHRLSFRFGICLLYFKRLIHGSLYSELLKDTLQNLPCLVRQWTSMRLNYKLPFLSPYISFKILILNRKSPEDGASLLSRPRLLLAASPASATTPRPGSSRARNPVTSSSSPIRSSTSPSRSAKESRSPSKEVGFFSQGL